MSGYSREYIGSVSVESGKVVVGDPVKIPRLISVDPNRPNLKLSVETLADEAVRNDQSAGLVKDVAVAVATQMKDGQYPVYVSYDERGEPTTIEISLIPE